MLATLVVPVALAGVTFVLYRCGVREGCRWAAWLAALVMAAGSFTVLHVFERGLTAGVLLESLVLVMAGGGLIARQCLGRQDAGRRSHFRVHRLKRGLF